LLRGKSLVLYELNEVPAKVLDYYVTMHPQSALARIVAHGTFVKTYATDSGVLSPWVTWPTVHRGVTNENHCISNFGQDLHDVDMEYPPIWDLLRRQGIRTGVFGSLHSYPPPIELDGYAFYVPDTFAAGPECFPTSLEVFQEFNLKMVDASARNVASGLPIKPAFELLRRAPGLGLRGATMFRLAKQLSSERINPMRKVRRRTSQVQLAFDFYYKQLNDSQPNYSSFFTNHVASSMHRYWPATFPADFKDSKLTDEWRRTYAREIDYTMNEADRQISRIVSFVRRHSGFVLVVVTSMGQAAADASEVIATQLQITDRSRFLQKLGVQPTQWSSRRAMLPRYVFHIPGDPSSVFRQKIASLTVNGEPISVTEHDNNVFVVKMGHVNLAEDQTELRLGEERISLEDMGLENASIQDETGSYAYHIPQGIMLLYDPAQERSSRTEIAMPTNEIAPMILRNFGLSVPRYM
jgi:hypothetical protein